MTPVAPRSYRTAAGLVLIVLAAACSPGDPGVDTTAVPTTAPVTSVPAPAAATTAPPTTTAPIEAEALPYRDATLAIDDRVEDLLGRMTIEEKIGQMTLVEKGSIRPEQVAEEAIGGVLSGGGGAPRPNNPAAWVEMTSGYQDAALSTRLGIPLLYGADAIHGHNNLRGAVIFPHNVGLGAAGDPDLVERIARATAVAGAATGVFWNYAPVLAVPQDIRWGRTYEAYGEDTDLVATLGAAFVRGLQGAALDRPDTMLATAKHFVADGGTEWGSSSTGTYQIDQGDARIDEETLRAVHVAPYRAALEAGAGSVMASYSSWQGEKVHASRFLITEVLKGELGFEGFVVSDWAAIDQIDPTDYYASVVAAINAGIDMNMVPTNFGLFVLALRGAVEQGDVPMERIDDAVRRILAAKFALGLFENPHPEPTLAAVIGGEEHRALAREAVRRSLVLLVNDAETLPLGGAAESVFLAGTAANDIGRQSGGWTITWQGGTGEVTPGTTIYDGLLERAGPGTEVVYDRFGRFDAPDVPARADVGIVVVGEGPYAEGVGDNPRLVLDGREVAIVERTAEKVDKLIVVVLSGRPLLLDGILDLADVVVAAWLPGSEGGAIADMLFGAEPFTGRLPYTWPRSIEQLPLGVLAPGGEGCDAPLFPYGHGLAADEAFHPQSLDCEVAA